MNIYFENSAKFISITSKYIIINILHLLKLRDLNLNLLLE